MPKKSSIAKAKYDAANSVRVTIKLNRRTDAPLLARLETVPSMSGYIRSLILTDIRKNAPEFLYVDPYEQASDGKQSLKKISPRYSDFFHTDDPIGEDEE